MVVTKARGIPMRKVIVTIQRVPRVLQAVVQLVERALQQLVGLTVERDRVQVDIRDRQP